jgi:ribosome maturation factor RimP
MMGLRNGPAGDGGAMRSRSTGGRKPTFLLAKNLVMRQTPELERRIESVVANEGLELVAAEVNGQGKGQVLRVFVDQPGGVGLAECERASRALSAALDAWDAAAGVPEAAYTLEVSSPGLDRPLRKPADFERFAGQRARVRTRAPRQGGRNFTGILEGRDASGIQLRPDTGAPAITIAWEDLEQARLAPLWPRPRRPGK